MAGQLETKAGGMSGSTLIHFVHEGKAAYPEISASKSYFNALGYQCDEVMPDAVASNPDGKSVCWHMMGLYPRRLSCDITIHDYR